MRQITGRFPSANGKSRAAYRIDAPQEGPVRGVLQLSHGMCEYVGRYDALFSALCGAGWVAAGHDHIGHGASAGSPEELGYFAGRDGWQYLVEDVHTMTGLLREAYPGVPLVLLGHSMGSFIARETLRRYGDGYDGAIICGTAGPNPAAALGIALASVDIALRGGHHRSALLQSLAFGGYNRRFEGRTPYDWLTRDNGIVDRYAADPFCTFIFTSSGFRDLFTLLRRVSRRDWAGSLPKKLPMLLIAGDMDPVGDYGRGVRRVYEGIRAAGCRDVSLKLYPGGRHEILNELNRDEVYQDVLAFCRRLQKNMEGSGASW